MAGTKQISAPISEETKTLIEEYTRATGIKKGYLVESALLYHLRALRELPADVLVPPRLVLTSRSFQAVAQRLVSPERPTQELRNVMSGDLKKGDGD